MPAAALASKLAVRWTFSIESDLGRDGGIRVRIQFVRCELDEHSISHFSEFSLATRRAFVRREDFARKFTATSSRLDPVSRAHFPSGLKNCR